MYSDILFDYLKSPKKRPRKYDYKVKSKTESGKDFSNDLGFTVSRQYYQIKSDSQSREFGKPKGKYELLSIPDVLELEERQIKSISAVVSKSISSLLGKIKNTDRILVVGLGNRHISSDSLGSLVCGKINVTFDTKTLPKVMAICPSVMGLTGIETVDIVEGVIAKVSPTHVIIIDSLCASAVERLGRSIQITNTGICPGGGIGNKRKCIGSDIAGKVVSIGVPLLIYSSTFVSDTMAKFGIDLPLLHSIMQTTKKSAKDSQFFTLIESLKKVLNDESLDMIVSIKDIEDCVQTLSKILALAINQSLGVARND